jgi:hypothetical protein
MAYLINVKTWEEFEDLVTGNNIELSRSIVNGIFDNLNTKKQYVHVLEIDIESEDKILDLTVDRNDFITTLEKNLEIHLIHEEYEMCNKIKKVIESLKPNT